MNTIEMEGKLRSAMVMAGVAVLLLLIGFLLAASQMLAFFLVAIILLALTWPIHAKISFFLGMATYGAGILVPLVKGRPLVWEVSIAMAWSGLPILYALRRQDKSMGSLFKNNKFLVLLPFAYCLVLLFLIKVHGVHFGNFGTTGAGGRRYAQQLVCAILPLLLISIVPSEIVIIRLFIVQALLSLSYVCAELILNFAVGDVRYILLFFDLTNDAVGFAANALSGGIQRFQSLYHFVIALTGLIAMWIPMNAWFTFRRFWVIPLLLAIISIGLLSGHRYVIYGAGSLLLGIAWAQRFFSTGRLIASVLLLGSMISMAYLVAPFLPDAAQRALTLLPGISVRPHVEFDANATLEGRREIIRVAKDLVPDHLWVGRGFGMSQEAIELLARSEGGVDTYALYSGLGVFYNGTLGFLINTGIPGTLVMMSFIVLGTILAFRIMTLLRNNGWDDQFSRLAGIAASYYLSQAFTTVFLHGDADVVMRVLGMQAGLLIVIEHRLRQRIRKEHEFAGEQNAEKDATTQAVGNLPVAAS